MAMIVRQERIKKAVRTIELLQEFILPFTLLICILLLAASTSPGAAEFDQIATNQSDFVSDTEIFSAIDSSSGRIQNLHFSPLTIINTDDRVRISEPGNFPYGAIAFMDVICECGCGWECSGFLAGQPNIVLTSAHSIICPDHSAPAESIILYFGFESYKKYTCRYDGPWKIWAGNDFSSHEYSFQGDWGLILLEENVGDQVGYLDIKWETITNSESIQSAEIVGYSGGELYSDKGRLLVMDESHYQYQMDQDTGSSGGPIWNDQKQVVGIVIGHQENDDGIQSNIGIMLTEELHKRYEEAVNTYSDMNQ